jgi:hypothetical protein
MKAPAKPRRRTPFMAAGSGNWLRERPSWMLGQHRPDTARGAAMDDAQYAEKVETRAAIRATDADYIRADESRLYPPVADLVDHVWRMMQP